MGTLKEHGFNECDPPICPSDITIEIINVECTNNNQNFILHVDWIIIDNTNSNLLNNINFNALLWACNDEDFDNIVYPSSGSQPYVTSFSINNCVGVVRLRVKIRIGTTFFEGEIVFFDTSGCLLTSEIAIRAEWCGDCT